MENNKKIFNKKVNFGTLIIAVVLSLLIGWLGTAYISQNTSEGEDNSSGLIKDTDVPPKPVTPAVSQTEGQTASEKDYYTQAVSNVRSCASTSCAPLGLYQPNQSLSLPFDSIQDMPEWVSVIFTGNDGNAQTGYISSALLGESKVSIWPQTAPRTQQEKPATSNSTTQSSADMKSFYASVENVFIIHNSGISYITSAMDHIAKRDATDAQYDLEAALGVVDLALNEYNNTVKNKYNNLPPDFNTAGACVGARIGYSYKLIDELSELVLSNIPLKYTQSYVEDMDLAEKCINDFLSDNKNI